MLSIVKWWRKHFLVAETVLAIFISLIFVAWVEISGKYSFVSNLCPVSAQVFAIFIALAILIEFAVSSYATDNRLAIIRESLYWLLLWEVFRKAVRASALAVVTSLLSIVSGGAYVLFYLHSFLAILAGFRLARCIWVFENVIQLIVLSSHDRGPSA